MQLISDKVQIEDINDLNLISSIIDRNKEYFVNYPLHFMFQTKNLITKEVEQNKPESVIRFFNTLVELNPLSPNIIRLLLQINNPNLLKKLINENIKIIATILTYTKAEAHSTDDLLEDGDIDENSEYIQYYNYCKEIETINIFIEELYPYLSPYNFSINENYLYFDRVFRKDNNLLNKELSEKQISLNLLLQVLQSNQHYSKKTGDFSTIDSVLEQIDQLKIKIIGNEKLTEITDLLNLTNSFKIKNKIIESLSIIKDETLKITELENILKKDSIYKGFLQKYIIDSLEFLKILIYIGEQHRNKIPLEENKLYQLCLKLIHINKDKILDNENSTYLEEVFKNIIFKISQEESFDERKKLWMNYFTNFIKLKTKKELILFDKIGIRCKRANHYTIKELESIEAEDYYEIFNQILQVPPHKKEKTYTSTYSNIEEIILEALLTLGKNITLHLIKKFNQFELEDILRKINNKFIPEQIEIIKKRRNTKNRKENEIKEPTYNLKIQVINDYLIPFFEKVIQLSNMYENRISYKNTEEYQNLYEIYKEYIKCKIQITNKKYNEKIEFIFNKLIRTQDFIKYFIDISSVKQIIMICKTENYQIEENKFSIEEIEEFNPKQYNDIRNRILKVTQLKENMINKQTNTVALKMLSFLGYDISKLLLQQKEISYSKLSTFIMSLGTKKKKNVLESFKVCLKEHPNIFELSIEQLEDYYNWYEYLYKNLKKKIKYTDIIEYQAISNEKLLSEANYFPIISNIHLVENKNHKRNIVKTGTLWLEQKERMYSTIPEYQNNIDNYHYEIIDMHNPNLIFSPNIVGCCMIVGGLAEADLIHAITNENGRLFGIYKDNEIIAISWIWRNNQVLCFDNIEVKKDMINSEFSKVLLKILKDAAKSIMKISQENENEKESIKIVTLGRNEHDIELELKEENLLSNYREEMFHPKNQEGLYLIDSSKIQYIIAGSYQENLNYEIKTKYRYPRKKPIRFDTINKLTLENMINSIKKDSGINTPNPIYTIGYLNEDYYIGVTTKNEIDIVCTEKDPRCKEEIINLLEILKRENMIFIEQKKQNDILIKSIMDNPYDIDKEKLDELISQINNGLSHQKDDYYYHGSSNKNILKILLTRKIMCPYQLGFRTKNNNGTYHLCIAKNLSANSNAFNTYVRNRASIILKKETPAIDRDSTKSNFLNPFPQENGKRNYGYEDEFHVLDQITDQYFEAVYLPTEQKEQLIFVRKVIDILDYTNFELPIVSSTNQKVINPQLIKQYIK